MAEQELFFIKPTAKVQASSESRGFYDEIVNGKGIFPQNISYIRLLSWWPCCAMQLLFP